MQSYNCVEPAGSIFVEKKKNQKFDDPSVNLL